jgi:uncharacterized protein (DUF736 family)
MSHQAPTYDNNMTGALFRNDRATHEKAPSHTGTLEINGVKYRLAAWVKEKKSDGQKFFSLKVEPLDAPREQAPSAQPDPLDADIPF